MPLLQSAPRAAALALALPWCAAIEVPKAKLALNGMAHIIRAHIQWNNWTAWSTAMEPFWTENFTYDFVHPFGKTHGLRDWYLGEHLHYNEAFPYFKSTNFLYLGEGDRLASLQSYHNAYWIGEFGGVPAPVDHPLIKIKDLDFYIIEGSRVLYNWCLVDVIAILQQGGYHVLPPPPLSGGIDYLPPRAMDGIPSPDDKYVDGADTEKARKLFHQMLQDDFVSQSTEASWWAPDLQWCGPAAVGLARTPEEYVRHFLRPLHEAFPKPILEVGSSDCEGSYCGALFYLVAEQTGPWLGEMPTGKMVRMKFAMHARVDFSQGSQGLIADAWVQMDIPDAFMQMGVDLLARAKEQAWWHRAKAKASSLAAEPEPAVRAAQQQEQVALLPAIAMCCPLLLVLMFSVCSGVGSLDRARSRVPTAAALSTEPLLVA